VSDPSATRLAPSVSSLRSAGGRPLRFICVGIVSTASYAVLYLLLRLGLSAAASNAIALAITAVGNTHANRHVTFGVRGNERLARHHAGGAAVFVLALGLTTGALAVLHAFDATPSRPLELAVLISASTGATIVRYLALSHVVFKTSRS